MADLTVTAASVVAGTNATIDRGTAGATITAGQLLYLDTSVTPSTYKLCDSDSATAIVRTPVGIALNGASSGQPLSVLTSGPINPGATVTVGRVYVASDTAGGIMEVGDLEIGDYVSVVGIGTTTSNINVQFIVSGVAVLA